MKNKSILLLILSMVMAMLLVGCGGESTEKIENVSDLAGKVIGMISPAASTENIEAMISDLIEAEPGQVVYFNRYSDGVTATITGKIDAVLTPSFVTNYHLKRNDNLKIIESNRNSLGSIIMAVRSEDQKLKEDLDEAITALQENGTLKTLEDQWITNLPADNEPVNKEIPKIEGAKTVYVGVCGDMAPLDYIAADGRPAGYNVAILTEIGKLLNINFEFVSLETQARFTALGSKKIDVIFCHFEANKVAFLEELKNNNWIGTKPYYTYDGVSFLVRK